MAVLHWFTKETSGVALALLHVLLPASLQFPPGSLFRPFHSQLCLYVQCARPPVSPPNCSAGPLHPLARFSFPGALLASPALAASASLGVAEEAL